MSESSIVTRDGLQIYFKDWGPKEAQPLVFHHGFRAERRARPLIEARPGLPAWPG